MDREKFIELLSARIDSFLEDEKKLNEFGYKKLREYTNKILQSSYENARSKRGIGIGGGIVSVALMGVGKLFSEQRVIDSAIKSNADFEDAQIELDKKWTAAKRKINLLSPNELFWIIHLNRKNGFEAALAYILSFN